MTFSKLIRQSGRLFKVVQNHVCTIAKKKKKFHSAQKSKALETVRLYSPLATPDGKKLKSGETFIKTPGHVPTTSKVKQCVGVEGRYTSLKT